MGGTFRFGSSCACHHSGIILGCLTAILLVVGTCTQSRAEENIVSITIDEPRRLEEGSEKKDFEDLRELILESFEDALSPDFEVSEDGDQAKYSIDLKIRGPYQECDWRVKCKWSEKNSDKKHNCWDPARINVNYCGPLDDVFSQIDCLGEIVDFAALVPPEPQKICAKQKKDKVVYTSCFRVELGDDTWNEKVRKTAAMIPLEIMRELSDEFKALGYRIVANLCPESTPKPQNIAFEIIGMVLHLPKEEIFVDLFVKEESAQAANDIRKINGKTRKMHRDKYRELGKEIIKYIKERFKSNE